MVAGFATVEVPRATYERVTADAEAWRELGVWLRGELPLLALLVESPHVRELVVEWVAWRRRQSAAADSCVISAGCDWRCEARAPSFAELQRRRAQPGVLAEEARARHGEYRGGRVEWRPGQGAGA